MSPRRIQNDLVYVVNPGNDADYGAILNFHSFPALGPLALATWVKQKIADIEVVARDGGAVSNDDLIAEIERLRPGIVGISVLGGSYQNSLKLAEAAKAVGSVVVFGNDQAAHLSRRILARRPQVDFVIASEYGEASFEFLIRALRGEKIHLADLPDLTYRHGGDIRGYDPASGKKPKSIMLSPIYKRYNLTNRQTALDIFPIPDRSLYPRRSWDTYLENYLDRFADLHDRPVTGVTTMNRARGCSRAAAPCLHCDMSFDIAFSSAQAFWEDVRQAHAQVGASVFYEVCDSFSSFPGLIDRLAAARPSDLGFEPQFFVYCQAIDLVRKPDLARRLKDLGVFRVNMGLESGCDITLRHMKGQYDSADNNYRALQLVNEQGLKVYGSFVLGTDPETPETMYETVRWIERVVKEGLLHDVEGQPILPLPGNYYGRRLAASGLLPKEVVEGDWPVDVKEHPRLYIDNFSGVSYERIMVATHEIKAIAEAGRARFGSGVARPDEYTALPSQRIAVPLVL